MQRLLFSGGKDIVIEKLILSDVEVNYEKDSVFSNSNAGIVMDYIKPKEPPARRSLRDLTRIALKKEPPASASTISSAATTEASKSNNATNTASLPLIKLHQLEIKDIGVNVWL